MSCDKTIILLREQSDCIQLYEMYLKCIEELKCIEGEINKEKRKKIKVECKAYVEKIEYYRLTMGYNLVFEKIKGLDEYYNDMIARNLMKEFESGTRELTEDVNIIKEYIKSLNEDIKKVNR